MRRFAATLMTLLLISVFALPASAQSPLLQATGDGVIVNLEVISTEFAGPNRIEVRRITGVITGDLDGVWTQEVRGVVHPNGLVTFQGVWEFSGKVGECGVGTISGRLTGRGQAGPFPDFPVTTAQARVTQQPSNTLGVVGQGVMDQQGPFVAYDIQYRCK
jgi:hypothetical protein